MNNRTPPPDLSLCRNWAGSPQECEHGVFPSAHGSIRCRGCHLHPDACTCGEATRRRFRALGYDLVP
jgi:hypothetical protein